MRSVFLIHFAELITLMFLLGAVLGYSDDLEILPDDTYIKLSEDGKGLNLYIRKKPGLQSILITESSADPEKITDSYAFRAWDYNAVNGDEKRILDGRFLESNYPLYFLLDSTPEPNSLFESAFHIFIPLELTYGYPWSREGQVEVHRGTWLNIRTFEKPYADYEGVWKDNPFILLLQELPPPPKPEIFTTDQGFVENIEDAVNRIVDIIGISEGEIDIVLVIDTTASMKDHVHFIRENLVPLIRKQVKGYEFIRIGVVLYRDYKEAYLTRLNPFTEDLDELQNYLNRITVSGGRDIPEAVTEGMYAALTEFEWKAPQRILIQIGDAPDHEEPKGGITPKMAEEEAQRWRVSIKHIRLPNNN